MVVGLSLPFGVGDVVRLVATKNDDRQRLVGAQGRVLSVRPGDRRVIARVAFEPELGQDTDQERAATLTYLEDELELVERYTHRG